MMRRLAGLSMISFIALPFAAGALRAQRDLVIDFRMNESGTSGARPVNGSGTGQMVMSKGRMRFEMTGNTQMTKMPGAMAGGDVTMLMLDDGKTMIILQPKTKQFMRIRPGEAMDGMQKMMEGMGANMKIDVTGDDPKVEKLGPGPDVVGHHTLHYRVSGRTRMSISVMGQHQEIETSSVVDQYAAPDLNNVIDPFRSLGANAMGGAMGAGMKAYVDKMKAAQAKVPGFPLRTESHVITSGTGQGSDIKSTSEVTRIQNTTASPGLFEVPPDYTQMTTPTMPPRRRDRAPSAKH